MIYTYAKGFADRSELELFFRFVVNDTLTCTIRSEGGRGGKLHCEFQFGARTSSCSLSLVTVAIKML